MSQERLQKIMSRAGICSRRKAEELISAGNVTINGRTAVLGDRADAAEDFIKVDGKRVPKAVPNRYLVVHKPEGYMSTVSDPEGRKTVMDLVPAGLRKALVPVGRLDYHTEGLLLLTTDGEFAHRVAHPRYGCQKIYEAKVKGMPGDEAVSKLREGMWIDGKRTEPADVSFLRRTKARGDANNTWWIVTLGEGRTRQIREMFYRVGHPVQRLRRTAIGPLNDRVLEKGSWRDLTEREIAGLLAPSSKSAKPGKKRAKSQKLEGRSSSNAEGSTSSQRRRTGERKARQVAEDAGTKGPSKKGRKSNSRTGGALSGRARTKPGTEGGRSSPRGSKTRPGGSRSGSGKRSDR